MPFYSGETRLRNADATEHADPVGGQLPVLADIGGVTTVNGGLPIVIKNEAGTSSARVTNGGLDVNIQDQHTEVVDLFMAQLIQNIAITTNTTLNDSTITVTSAGTPVVGNIVCLKESTAFYQGRILSVVANGTDWDLALDIPLDYAYTTLGGCSERNTNMAVDGSTTAVEFDVSPGGLEAGTSWDIVRFIARIIDSTAMDDAKFGGQAALTRGVYLRTENGIKKNLLNIKSNGDWRLRAFDVTYSDKAPSGSYGFGVRRTYGGQDKSGVTLRITDDDRIVFVIQDDLTGIDSFEVCVQGHVVE